MPDTFHNFQAFFYQWLQLAFILFSFCLRFASSSGVPEYRAVFGGEIELPCNISDPAMDDSVSLIIWYRGDTRVPVYSVDARNNPVTKSKHFPSDIFGTRAHFDLSTRPAILHIQDIQEEDAGIYRCRVDYRWARTQYTIVILDVVVPARQLIIMDHRGHKVDDIAGPYDEETEVQFICEARGGRPSPVLTWWRDLLLLDDSYTVAPDGTVRNEMILSDLQREDLMTALTCQAMNTNLTAPVRRTITLDMNLKPLDVHIISIARPLSAGRKVEMVCQSRGSRPPAQISWWKNKKELRQSRENISEDGNLTTSLLHFIPSREDHGVHLVCRAENTKLGNSAIEDGWTLNIMFPPEVSLALAVEAKQDVLKEGKEIFMECYIQANPPVDHIYWRFNGQPIINNPLTGILISNATLVLREAKRENRGHYKCEATNAEGSGESNDLYLDIQYAPVCKPGQKIVYGVAVAESSRVLCEVEAEPPDVTFQWVFNNSRENRGILRFSSEGRRSSVAYTPATKHDFGTLLCWAKNVIGEQQEPCVFTIIPAGPPEPLRECFVTNYTHDVLMIKCKPGYDGGLHQVFHLEVYDEKREKQITNATGIETPVFLVTDLPSATNFQVIIYAANAKGRSSAMVLTASTLDSPFMISEDEASTALSPLLGVLIGIVGSLMLTVVVAIVIIRLRGRHRKHVSRQHKSINRQVTVLRVDESPGELDSKSPDIIPLSNECFDYSEAMKDYYPDISDERSRMYDGVTHRHDLSYNTVPTIKIHRHYQDEADDISYGEYPSHMCEYTSVSNLRETSRPLTRRDILALSTPV